MIQLVTASAIAALSLLIAYAAQGTLGLSGAGLGVGVAALMCGASGWILRATSKARGQALVAGMLGSVAASFVILGAAMVLVAVYWRAGLEAASLTALAIYLGYRFVEAFAMASLARSSKPTSGGGLA